MDILKSVGAGISALVTGIFGLAILAILLSNNSATANVLSTFFQGLSSLIQVTVSPITGSSSTSSSSSSSNNILSGILGSSGSSNILSGILGGSGSTSSPLTSIEGLLGNSGLGGNGSSGSEFNLGSLEGNLGNIASIAGEL